MQEINEVKREEIAVQLQNQIWGEDSKKKHKNVRKQKKKAKKAKKKQKKYKKKLQKKRKQIEGLIVENNMLKADIGNREKSFDNEKRLIELQECNRFQGCILEMMIQAFGPELFKEYLLSNRTGNQLSGNKKRIVIDAVDD